MRGTIGLTSKGANTFANVAALALAMGRGVRVHVGVVDDGKGAEGSDEREGGADNVTIAATHEFGNPDLGIPERSFLRSTLAAKRHEWVAFLGSVTRKVIRGELSVAQAYNQLGAKAAADVKYTITGGPPLPPPNAPETAERKRLLGKAGGVVRTLVDTGQLVGSIAWRLVGL